MPFIRNVFIFRQLNINLCYFLVQFELLQKFKKAFDPFKYACFKFSKPFGTPLNHLQWKCNKHILSFLGRKSRIDLFCPIGFYSRAINFIVENFSPHLNLFDGQYQFSYRKILCFNISCNKNKTLRKTNISWKSTINKK